MSVLLDNLSNYTKQARAKVTEANKSTDRKKLYLVNSKYSHHEEIVERLQFLKYIASIATEKIHTRIYDPIFSSDLACYLMI